MTLCLHSARVRCQSKGKQSIPHTVYKNLPHSQNLQFWPTVCKRALSLCEEKEKSGIEALLQTQSVSKASFIIWSKENEEGIQITCRCTNKVRINQRIVYIRTNHTKSQRKTFWHTDKEPLLQGLYYTDQTLIFKRSGVPRVTEVWEILSCRKLQFILKTEKTIEFGKSISKKMAKWNTETVKRKKITHIQNCHKALANMYIPLLQSLRYWEKRYPLFTLPHSFWSQLHRNPISYSNLTATFAFLDQGSGKRLFLLLEFITNCIFVRMFFFMNILDTSFKWFDLIIC